MSAWYLISLFRVGMFLSMGDFIMYGEEAIILANPWSFVGDRKLFSLIGE